jgi:hypothetical protein
LRAALVFPQPLVLSKRRQALAKLDALTSAETSYPFNLVALTEARPLSKREMNKILKAHVKQVARDISAMVNGTKEIVLVNESATREAFEVAAAPQEDNKADAELSGELLLGPTRSLGRPLSGTSGQRLYRSVGASSSEGLQVLPANGYPAGIRWPRRLR